MFQDVTEEEKIERDRILVDTVTKYVNQLNGKLSNFKVLVPKLHFVKLLITSFREQKLANLMHDKKYLKAIGLAITLDQPFKVLNVIKG